MSRDNHPSLVRPPDVGLGHPPAPEGIPEAVGKQDGAG